MRILYATSRLQNFGDLEFDLSRSLKVKSDSAIGLLIYGFLLMCNSNIGPKGQIFQGHSRSDLMVPLDSPYMVSY